MRHVLCWRVRGYGVFKLKPRATCPSPIFYSLPPYNLPTFALSLFSPRDTVRASWSIVYRCTWATTAMRSFCTRYHCCWLSYIGSPSPEPSSVACRCRHARRQPFVSGFEPRVDRTLGSKVDRSEMDLEAQSSPVVEGCLRSIAKGEQHWRRGVGNALTHRVRYTLRCSILERRR